MQKLSDDVSRSHPERDRGKRPGRKTAFIASVLLIALMQCCVANVARAQSTPAWTGPDVQKRANGVLALLSFTVTPDLSASSLGIRNGTTGNPSLNMTQVGGGFTLSPNFPLY